MTFVDFDPKRHKGLPLLEVVSVRENGLVATVFRPAEVDEETAAKIPWYFVVQVEGEEA